MENKIHTGVDIVDIDRMRKLITAKTASSRFESRIFTESERAWIAGNPKRAAGCFAAKEAFAKALGTGFRGFSTADVEISHDEAGAPVINVRGEAERLLAGRTISISITHSELVAAAFVIIY